MVIGLLSSCTLDHSAKKNNIQIIHTEGSQIIDTNGNPILLKGTNLGNWLVPEGYMFKTGDVAAPSQINQFLLEMIGPDSLATFWDKYLNNYITEDDIRFLKRIGCNHIRLPFHYKLFTNDLYMGKRNAGFEYFDRLIDWCRKENIYVLLDMHCAPGGQTGYNIDDSSGYPWLFFSQSSQNLMSEIWVEIAERYKDDPIVLGYDITNEPIASYFIEDIPDYNNRLFLLYERLVTDIRQVDRQHSIFLSGSLWAMDFGVFESVLDDNIVYEFHKYHFPVKQEAIQQYIDFRDKYNVPIYLGESGENSDEWVGEFTNLLDSNKISWAFWPYKKMESTSCLITFNQPQDYSLILEYAYSDRSAYHLMRENMPDRVKVQKTLTELLDNLLFNNNISNKGYIESLGLNAK